MSIFCFTDDLGQTELKYTLDYDVIKLWNSIYQSAHTRLL